MVFRLHSTYSEIEYIVAMENFDALTTGYTSEQGTCEIRDFNLMLNSTSR